MTFEITNRQKIKKINADFLRRCLGEVFRILSLPPYKLSVLICDDRMITALNKEYFNKNCPTDVIAFPLREDGYLGEVAVSLERAVSVCRDYGNSWRKELVLYLVHGVLHLTGYKDTLKKDRILMREKESEIMEKLTCLLT